MPISIVCGGCGKTLHAPDSAAGRRAKCPQCQSVVTIPKSLADASIDDLLGDILGTSNQPPAAAPSPTPIPQTTSSTARSPAAHANTPALPPGFTSPDQVRPVARPATAPVARFTAEDPGGAGFARIGYLLFALVLVPLAISLLSKDEDITKRLEATAERHPEVFNRFEKDDNASAEDLFNALPDNRLEGAFLSCNTWMHWGFALVSVVCFFGVACLLFERGGADLLHLLLVALFTATFGIISLLLFQLAADFTQGFWLRGRGFIVILFYIVKFIGFSYRAASDPEYGFWMTFLGFTCAVGLCEELTKALPLLSRMGKMEALGWRGMCLWGLASGMGFGVAEGIMYSSNHYNGVATGGIYLVRFVSCVGLHAMWAAAVGISMWKDREMFDQNDMGELVGPLLKAIAIPMVLHGLYDTLLKRDMNLYALLIAGLSFAWLVWQVESARSTDDETEVPLRRSAMA